MNIEIDWNQVHACVWREHRRELFPVKEIDPISLGQLRGIEKQKQELVDNTNKLLSGKPRNHALLWGSRGTGKSSLVKAVFNQFRGDGLRLIEIFKNHLHVLPEIVDTINDLPQKFIIYCDDFSFDLSDHSYIALKTIFDGSVNIPPDNLVFYVTSNRRHLVPESIEDNLGTTRHKEELHYSDAVEEKISLSDRFGLWLSFYPLGSEEYLQIVDDYFPDHSNRELLHNKAIHFANRRSSKSGRTARQFYQHYSE